MADRNIPAANPRPPALAELLSGFLERQARNHTSGLAALDITQEAVPFQSMPAPPIDPARAWDHALAAILYYKAPNQPDPGERTWQPPPEWPALVAGQEAQIAPAFCIGNYPQLVRDLQPFLHPPGDTPWRPSPSRASSLPALQHWAEQTALEAPYPLPLLAIGILRLANQFDGAAELLKKHASPPGNPWQAGWANEQASLAWHSGQPDEAAALWQRQVPSPPVLFNRGLAALFLSQPGEARGWFEQAVELLPEASAWHHLGRLYMALATMRE